MIGEAGLFFTVTVTITSKVRVQFQGEGECALRDNDIPLKLLNKADFGNACWNLHWKGKL